MKNAWYMYCNDYNYGMRENGLAAIEEIQSKTGNVIPEKEISKIINSNSYSDGAYKTIKEKIKI